MPKLEHVPDSSEDIPNVTQQLHEESVRTAEEKCARQQGV